MEEIRGKSILGRVAVGKLFYYKKPKRQVRRVGDADPETELRRYEEAVQAAENELLGLYEKACREVGEVNAAVFEVHRMMLADEDYQDSVVNIIKGQRVNAEYAVAVTGDNFQKLFASMEDEYFKARAADVKDVSDRLHRLLSGQEESRGLSEPAILMAKDLVPSETVQLDKRLLLGFVTEQGSLNSHTAILARTMNIPALVGVPVREEWDGHTAAIDGETGTLYVDPDPKTLAFLKEKQACAEEKRRLLLALKDKEDVTLDGKRIKLYGNIGSVADVASVLQYNAAGIGLFRSEFLYLEKDTYPSEEEQFAVYKQVAEMMAGREVIIRTLDIGADKQAAYFELDHEENPALGYRAIRICLTRPEIFKTQLRAIYRASAFGTISVMFPMIASLWEVKRAKELAAEVRNELESHGIPFGRVALGIMIETPAAAVISDRLAKEVDFFSIGTNDLIQYTLAVDRQNERLEEFYDSHHEAVLRLIEHVVRSGHAAGCSVGICGELGADTALTERFLRMGVDELSVSPAFLLEVREKIRGTDLRE
ncbi:MAG: phosphoenolpyruvate--protein phosphotransferase [Lachnospiraceae bacterium]|nr:phosphoenolpyruvate--protein phosphotransferase [Lachnospiraceae bacterium]